MKSDIEGRDLTAAEILIDIGAVNIRPQTPFILTSGLASPVYVDCRRLISFPRERERLMLLGAQLLQDVMKDKPFNVLAGGETGGIAFAAWLSHILSLPMIYVRKKPKGFGRNAQIEGLLNDEAKILLVEDLATDGASKIMFAEAIRDAGADITDAFTLFYYDIFPSAQKRLENSGICLHYLATWWDILQCLKLRGGQDPQNLAAIEAFFHDPFSWSTAHGGRGQISN